MFHHMAKNEVDVAKSAYIFMWAPIAWALAGYILTGWRWVFKTGEQGRDCLIFAALLSVVMAVVCGSLLPETPPAGESQGAPVLQALSMLKNSNFLVFIVITMVAAGMMQFYFLGTALCRRPWPWPKPCRRPQRCFSWTVCWATNRSVSSGPCPSGRPAGC
jgi:hypothetical protein